MKGGGCWDRLFSRYTLFLVDLWGVIWLGRECVPVPGAADFVRKLIAKVPAYFFLSNTVWPRERLRENLLRMDVDVPVRRFITAGRVVKEWIGRIVPAWRGLSFFHVGRAWERPAYFGALRFAADPCGADVVIVGDFSAPEGETPAEAHAVERVLRVPGKKRTVIVCNPDERTLQPSGRYNLQAGWYLARLARRYPRHRYVFAGKPGRLMFDYALEAAGCRRPGDAVMIGDTIETDVAGARAAGIAAVYVKSGELSPVSIGDGTIPATFPSCEETGSCRFQPPTGKRTSGGRLPPPTGS